MQYLDKLPRLMNDITVEFVGRRSTCLQVALYFTIATALRDEIFRVAASPLSRTNPIVGWSQRFCSSFLFNRQHHASLMRLFRRMMVVVDFLIIALVVDF